MTTTRKSLQLCAMLFAFLAIAAAAVETRMPTNIIAVDKSSYEAGDEIFITGEGWIPGELVTIQISEDGNPGHVDTLYVTADVAGAVTIEHILAGHGSPQNFTVTATSPSLEPTTTTFSDAGNRGPLSWDTSSWSTAPPTTTPWVRTDRDDYHPAEVAQIAGGGWIPGDLVTFEFTEVGPSVFHPTVRVHAIADAAGNVYGGYVLQRHDEGETYSLTATSSANQAQTAQTTFTDSAYAYGHTCAVRSTGALNCWGWNDYGQVGDGTAIQRLTPVTVSGLSSGVAQVSTGYLHTCALLTSGGVKCWGYGGEGQLGTGTNSWSMTPVNVTGLASGVAQVSAGIHHTCALMTSGSVWCWGYNAMGQLGDGTFTSRLSPVSVSGLTSGVLQITTGAYHTCALLASGGAQCWGYNTAGGLGDGTTTQRPTPVNVSGLTSGVAQISAGVYHTCALLTSGGVKCWGYNGYGQLGDGTTSQRLTPVDVFGLTSGVAQMRQGYLHSCALTTSGGVKCWGWNANGQVGDATGAQRLTPTNVSGLTSGVAQIMATGEHSCALLTTGAMQCWGWNGYGQLGDGTTSIRLAPVTVSGLTAGVVAVPDSTGTMYALTYAAGPNGSLTGPASQIVPKGSSGSTVTAVPNPGYRFVTWSDGVLTVARTDTNVNGNLSVTASFAIDTVDTTVALVTSANPITYGSPLTLTATVTPVAPFPATMTGTVTFNDGGTPVGSAAVNAAGVAILTVSPSAGPHSYTADYGGDAHFLSSSSGPVPQTVDPAILTVAATSTSRPYGTANPAFTASFSGFVAGETLATSGVTGSPSLTTTAVSTSPTGSYAITAGLGTLAAANYTFSFVDGTLTIVAASQTITFNALGNKTYGDPPFAVTATASSGLPVAFSVFSGPATISGNTVTLTGSGTVVIRASQAGNANFNAAPNVDRSFTVAVPDLNVTSITMETRPWSSPVPASSAQAIAIYNSLPLGVPGYATGPKTLTLFDNVSNQLTFSGSSQNIGYHHHFAFNAPVAGTLSVRLAGDFGGGGTLIIDGTVLQFRNTDMWWNFNYSDPNQYLSGTVSIAAGPHTIDSYGFEICCDGPQQAQYSYLGAAYKTFAAPANTVPVVALSGPASVTVGESNTYTFSVTDPDAGASFAVRTVSCGVNGTLDGSVTTTPSGGSFNCIFPNAATTSIVSVDVTDNFGAVSNTATRSVTSSKLTQTISFPDPPDTAYGAADFPVAASASSGLPVTIVASGPCVLSSGSVHITGAGTCVLTASQAGNATYLAAANVVQSVAIAQASLTVKADDKSRPYGAANPALTATISGFVNGETLATSGVTGSPSLSTAAINTSAVGGHPITVAAGTLAAANYSFVFVAGTLTVNAVQLTVTARSANRPYGAANPDVSTPLSISGFANGESATALTTQPTCATTAAAASPIGPYPVECSGGAATNYTFQYVAGTLTVDAVQLTVTARSANRPYAAANPDLSTPLSISGFVNLENATLLSTQPTCATTAAAASPIGPYPVTCSGGTATNYTFQYVAGTLTVDAVQLTVTARSANRPYAAANPDLSTPLSISGFVGGQDATVLGTQPTCATTATAASPIGPYPVTCGGGAATNYMFQYVAGTLTVDAVQLTVTARSANRPYAAANPDVSTPLSVTGFVGGENVGVLGSQPVCATTATAASPIGPYPVTCSSGAATNYTFQYVAGTLTVDAVQLTVTARSANRPYAAANPDLSTPLSISGFVGGETATVLSTQPTCATTATAASPIGPYPVTCSGGAATNYTFSYALGTLAVDPVQLTVTAKSATRPYGAANPDVSAPLSITGFVGGETAFVLGAQPTCSTTATQASGAGSYPVTCGGGAAGNYTFSYVPGSLTIQKVQLTVTGKSPGRLYGAANPNVSAPQSITGFIDGETASVLTTQPTCTTTATPASPVGSYPVTCSGAYAANYSFAYVAGALNVGPVQLTVTAKSASRVYGSPNPDVSVPLTITGFVLGQMAGVLSAQPACATTATAASPVASYPVTCGGAAATNYTFAYVPGTLTVTRALLTVTALNLSRQYSDPNPALTYAISGFVNGDTIGVVGGAPALTTTATQLSPVGNYPIVPTIGSLTAANYSFVYFVNGVLVVTREDAAATYIGLTYVSTASATSSTALVTLRATIQDITAVSPALDGAPGNITTATVQFVNRDAGSAPLCSATLSLVSLPDSKTATASCDYTFNIGSADSDSINIGIVVTGNYTRNSGNDDSVITISKPLTAFITGGGYLILQSSSGVYGGTPASKMNFGFNAKSKGKNTLQGKVNIIIRKDGRVYQVKSTAIDSLTSRAWTSTAPGLGSFQSKGALQDITDPLAPISMGGNLTIQMTFTDNGEPGSADTLALTVWDGSTLLFSSRWSGVATLEQLLVGGNAVSR